jgi:hypothetical protein
VPSYCRGESPALVVRTTRHTLLSRVSNTHAHWCHISVTGSRPRTTMPSEVSPTTSAMRETLSSPPTWPLTHAAASGASTRNDPSSYVNCVARSAALRPGSVAPARIQDRSRRTSSPCASMCLPFVSPSAERPGDEPPRAAATEPRNVAQAFLRPLVGSIAWLGGHATCPSSPAWSEPGARTTCRLSSRGARWWRSWSECLRAHHLRRASRRCRGASPSGADRRRRRRRGRPPPPGSARFRRRRHVDFCIHRGPSVRRLRRDLPDLSARRGSGARRRGGRSPAAYCT